MNEVERIQKLADAARGTLPPRFDVTDRVLHEIRHREDPSIKIFGTFAAVASLAAMLMIGWVGVEIWGSLNDPLIDMFTYATAVIS